MVLTVGEPAPDFTLPDSQGSETGLSDFAGRWLVLWWFPKAKSTGCTLQARGVDALARGFAGAPVVFVGVSYDPPDVNREFCLESAETVTFLSDASGDVAARYGTKRGPEEEFSGAPRRMTFVIDPDQRIRRIFTVQDVSGHADEVRGVLVEALKSNA
ncbi:MAG: redoxin domain-containing protein [Actinobacteria bacterium]|nr:redoxin domain-containing protein [Actinomycetota bacterium]